MQDTVQKGTGNSRTIKTVPNFLTLYPTYESFAQALIAGTLPIDLGPLNSAGLQTSGTPYNKANVLPNATCTNLGIATSSVPKDAFNALRTLVQTAQNTADTAQSTADAAPKVLAGSYTGTGGTKGGSASNPMSLTFPFVPKIVMIPWGQYRYNYNISDIFFPVNNGGNYAQWIMLGNMLTTEFVMYRGFTYRGSGTTPGKKSADGKTFYWYVGDNTDEASNAVWAMNESGCKYYYIAIG